CRTGYPRVSASCWSSTPPAPRGRCCPTSRRCWAARPGARSGSSPATRPRGGP
ncbi:MAG: hypothetical protein AVDCRST_MAG66-1807, partial [uncultured Pseudonocardia sp.]